jgi:SAM-dependent methyltransferase
MTDLVDLITDALRTGQLATLVASRPVRRNESEPGSIRIRPIELRAGVRLQWTSRYERRESHENLTVAESIERLPQLLSRFRDIHLMTATADYQARADRAGQWRWKRRDAARSAEPASHNRAKQYLIPEGVPCPFLEAIGVMNARGQVRAAAHDKFRQINRYLEFVNDVYPELAPEGTLSIVDFGCGKSSLTFALHHLLTKVHHRDVRIVGLDRQPDVIRICSDLSAQLELQGLDFRVGEIADHEASGEVDLAVSLHACDTATDDAIARAVQWKARVIFAVPCCQHEIASKMTAPVPLLEHGILKERFAAITTDSLRAAALEATGYRTQVIEFIDLEHTPKNVLIRAVRRGADSDRESKGRHRFDELKRLVGVAQTYLESVLNIQEHDDKV